MQKSICAEHTVDVIDIIIYAKNDWFVPSLPAIGLLQLPARSVACTLPFLTISSMIRPNQNSFAVHEHSMARHLCQNSGLYIT